MLFTEMDTLQGEGKVDMKHSGPGAANLSLTYLGLTVTSPELLSLTCYVFGLG